MDSRNVLGALIIGATLALASPAYAACGNQTYIEGGYTADYFDYYAPDAHGGYVHGSYALNPSISAYAEYSQGKFDSNVTPGDDDHRMYGAGVMLSHPANFGYWQASVTGYGETFGGMRDRSARFAVGGCGNFTESFGWNASFLYDTHSGRANRATGFELGAAYDFTDEIAFVVNTHSYSHDTMAEIGLRWYP